MGFGWNTLKDPFKGIPVVGGVLDAAYDSLPIDNVVRMGEDIAKGDWGSAATNLGIGALETAAMFLPGSAALASSGAKLGSKAGLTAIAKGIARPGTTAGLSRGGRLLANFAGPSVSNMVGKGVLSAAGSTVNALRNPAMAVAAPMAPAAGTGPGAFRMMDQKLSRPTASAANFRMADQASMKKYEESQRQKRLAAGGGSGTGSGSPALATGKPAAGPTSLEAALGGWTPEQIWEIGQRSGDIQSKYDTITAELAKREAMGRAAQEQANLIAGNTASGESQNLATNLGSIGMDLSPAAANVGQESISNTMVQKQAQANKTLADLLGEIQSSRAQQVSDKLTGETELEKLKKLMLIQNAMERQKAAYDQMGTTI